jgi:hypothetical protein
MVRWTGIAFGPEFMKQSITLSVGSAILTEERAKEGISEAID